jgi:hypothetical protein
MKPAHPTARPIRQWGVSRNHIADIELGVRNTAVWSLLLICRALALQPAALFEDFPPPGCAASAADPIETAAGRGPALPRLVPRS